MKRALIAVIVVLVLAFASLAANEDISLTPADPYPSENLLCTYRAFQRGQVLEFLWYVNDEIKDRKVTDKQSSIFSQQKKKNDRVKCELNGLDPATLQRNWHVGSQSVIVGQYECNDGLDNDGDGNIDSLDADCLSRTAPSEGIAINITPHDPYPEENLLCTFLNFRQGDVLEFAWFVNDELKERKVVDKQSTIFSKPTQRLDKVRCEVYRSLNGQRGNTIGIESVTIGRWTCNDGLDNDNDNLIDGQDNGCTSRLGKSEFFLDVANFCTNHPNNLFCMGLGGKDLVELCDRDPENVHCHNEFYPLVQGECAGREGIGCQGIEDLAEQCQQPGNPNCQAFLLGAQFCQERNVCLELTDADKRLLCRLHRYSFCGDCEIDADCAGEKVCKEQFCVFAASRENDKACKADENCDSKRCVNQICAAPQAPEIRVEVERNGVRQAVVPERQDKALGEVAVSEIVPDASVPDIVPDVKRDAASPVCGNQRCEGFEEKTCSQDCQPKRVQGIRYGNENYVPLFGLLAIAAGVVVYRLVRKRKRR